MSVPPPGQIVTAQGAGVVLQLDQVESAAAQHHQVNLVPLAVGITEFEVRPGAEGGGGGQQGADDAEALGLVGELGGGDLNPALDALRHGPVSLTCPRD